MLGDIIADVIFDLIIHPIWKGLEFIGGSLKRSVSKAATQFRRGAADAKSDESE
ncbi:hypothetical protein ACH9L7_11955 [Haloferax sp. S1W]|uniref:hypothetical protein n=1 Tax=Haloferax sp. S1W TaxID=3377110 RepID=UPI0037C53832